MQDLFNAQPFWVIIRRTDNVESFDDMLKSPGRPFVAVDGDKVPLQFDSAEKAFTYLTLHYSALSATIAKVPTISGDSETGFMIEE